MNNVTLIAALVAGVISLVGILVNYFISKNQIKHKIREVEIKEEELKINQKNLKREIEELKQTQMQSIIEKRLEAYPKLWSIHIRYETNWSYEKKKKDSNWAQKYVKELNDFNVEYGLFFSQDLYAKFFELRRELYLAIDNTKPETLDIPENFITNIRNIVYGTDKNPGLSTIEKDDFGSYLNVVVARRK